MGPIGHLRGWPLRCADRRLDRADPLCMVRRNATVVARILVDARLRRTLWSAISVDGPRTRWLARRLPGLDTGGDGDGHSALYVPPNHRVAAAGVRCNAGAAD